MGNRLMSVLRHAFGLDRPPDPERELVQHRLDEQAARLRAMDAQVDAGRVRRPLRRVGDRR